ncbi:MAG: HDIG domain-containing protein [Caldilineaceae bacterium]
MSHQIQAQRRPWLDRLLSVLMMVGVGILMVGLLSWQFPRTSRYQLEEGRPAPSNIVSPRQIRYESELLTEEARVDAANAVPAQYDPPESRVRRQQVDKLTEILEFISIVRNDAYADDETKTDYLQAIAELNLGQESILHILDASDDEWREVVAEAPLALGRAMREEIRNDESALRVARRDAVRLIGPDLSEDALSITTELVLDLIRPNSFYNEERTEEARVAARDATPAQRISYEQDEMILREGDIVTPLNVETLEHIGLLQGDWDWWTLIRALLFTVITLATVVAMLYRLHPRMLVNNQMLALLTLSSVIWLLLAKFMLIPHDWLPYLYPLATLIMLLTVLVDLRVALIVLGAFTFVVLYLSDSNPALAAYAGLGSLFGALVVARAERLTVFLWAGVVVSLCNLLVTAAFRAPFVGLSTQQQMLLLLVHLLNGSLSASVALIGYFVLGNIFGITTSLQLTELSRPTHPLLRQLLLKSPGTYHHTIVVSNLAERAAAAIGADAFLARVGAYYHDIGKTVRPYFFIENSADGAENPHEKLDPLTSAQIIISHVSDGVDLAQKYRLPGRIQDFIREHHGTSLVHYFYMEAQKHAPEGETVNQSDFRYDGPRPRTKETAILMLADMCESAIRAVKPATRTDLTNLVNKLIDTRVMDGELNDSNLTFQELQIVKDVFLRVLQGVHHPRIVYPERSKASPTQATASPAGPSGQPARMPQTASPLNGAVRRHTSDTLVTGDALTGEFDVVTPPETAEEPGGVEQPA